jgi:hypothetical protein
VEPMLLLLDDNLLAQGVAELPPDHRGAHRRVRGLPVASLTCVGTPPPCILSTPVSR